MTAKPLRLRPTEPTEHDIQTSILDYLRVHPRVVWVGRFNSGSTFVEGKNGFRRIQFCRVSSRYYRPRPVVKKRKVRGVEREYTTQSELKCPDILGMLRDGRLIAIEVKRRGGKRDPDQQSFIDIVQMGGGIGLTAESVDEVAAALAAEMGGAT